MIINDWLHTNRTAPARIFEHKGTLYVDHATDTAAPEVEYSENILLDFAGAYYPVHLLEFMEKYGTLFNIDQQANISLPQDAETTAPTEETMRAALALLSYPDGKKRKVSQDIKRLQRDCIERDTGLVWFTNQREYFGDWVAARAVFQKALLLLDGRSGYGVKSACPDFSINLANAPRYRAFLETATNGQHWTVASHGADGVTTEEQGVYLDGETLVCHCPGQTVEQAISRLITVHTLSAVKLACVGLELVEQYTNLLQVIWCQFADQLNKRVVIEYCENPLCGNVMLRMKGASKHACCDSCQQALKEGRR